MVQQKRANLIWKWDQVARIDNMSSSSFSSKRSSCWKWQHESIKIFIKIYSLHLWTSRPIVWNHLSPAATWISETSCNLYEATFLWLKFRTCLESVTTIRHWTMHRPFYTNAHLAQITKSNLLPCKLQNASCVQRVPISCLVNSASWCHPIFGSLLENPFEHRRDQGILKDWLGPTNGPIYLEQW